ncbi:MAG: serine/threonine-protein kinase, partial [Dokdonella sp.]
MAHLDDEILRRAAELFDRLLDLDDDQRDAEVEQLGETDTLKHRLRRLLAAHRNVGPLDRAHVNVDAPPARIGGWTIVKEIGRGGMAVVYRAKRNISDTTQIAALKLMTIGSLVGLGQERFLREQSILTRLDHPNIAGLLDAGVLADGTPWLAMVLVEGERIDSWCLARGLGSREIVEVFLNVCSAVAYAHRSLIVHRDLKPSNILVDGDGRTRLLDFGIARLIDDDSAADATATAMRAMTPRFAAPEQFGGQLTTTATDVFGLGAVLYMLLAGRPPRDLAADPDQIFTLPSRAASENPDLPADLRQARQRELSGDLDTIVLKALASEPERRYASAEGLASDLRAWLARRPIAARPYSLWYQTSRFVRRNRLAVAAALLATVLIGLAVWQVALERDNARMQALRAIEVRDFLGSVFASAEPSTGTVPTLVDVLDSGSQRAREDLLARDPLAAADVLAITGSTYINSSAYDKAARDLEQAHSILMTIQPPPARELAGIFRSMASLARVRGETAKAINYLEQATAWSRRSDAPAEESIGIEVSLAATQARAGKLSIAETTLRRLLEEIDKYQLTDSQLHLDALNALGTALALQLRAYPEQAALHEQRLAITRTLYGADTGLYAYALADSVPTFRKAGQIARAEAVAREAVSIADQVYKKPHMYAAVANCNLAAMYQHEGRLADAATTYDRSIAMDEAIGRTDLHAESCRRDRAYVRAARGDFVGSRADLKIDQEML